MEHLTDEKRKIMVKLIFKEGSNILDPNAGPQPPMFDRFRNVLSSALSTLPCPNHGVNSYATLLIDVDSEDSNWEVMDFCCPDFSGIVESEMPFPWNHARRHLKS